MSIETLPPQAFDAGRLRRDGTWLVGFLADWCPFCRQFRPKLDAVRGSGTFEVGIGNLTSDDSPLWDEFGIEVVPALIVFQDGAPIFAAQSDPGVGLPLGTLERAVAIARAAHRA